MISVCIALHLSVTIPVWIHPIGVAMEDSVQKMSCMKSWKPACVRVIVRSCLILSLCAVAILSPQFTPLVNVSSTITTTIICMILPAVLYVLLKFKLKQKDQTLAKEDGKDLEILPRPDSMVIISDGRKFIENTSGVDLLPEDVAVQGPGPLASRDGQIRWRAWVLVALMCVVGAISLFDGFVYNMKDLITSWSQQNF